MPIDYDVSDGVAVITINRPRRHRHLHSRAAALPATGFPVEAMINRLLMATEDAKEGPAAFREKRPADVRGR